MAQDQPHANTTTRTRSLRKNQTKSEGLTIVRFTDDHVEQDTEAVGRAIAKELNVPYEFKKRSAMGSGSKGVKAAKAKKVKPSPR